MSDRLIAKVAAVNRCHAAAKELFPQLVAIFTPLVGQKLEKASGGLLQKIRALLPEFPNTQQLQIYRSSSAYSLTWNVKTCELTPPNGCVYHEVGVYVGSMSNGILTSVSENLSELRSDYTVEEVLRLRANYTVLKNAAQNAYGLLSDFGEYDR